MEGPWTPEAQLSALVAPSSLADVRSVARKYVGRQNADDVAQDTLAACTYLIGVARGAKDREGSRPWVFAVLKNCARAWVRKNGGQLAEHVDEIDDVPGALEQEVGGDLVRRKAALEAALADNPKLAKVVESVPTGEDGAPRALTATERKRRERAIAAIAMAVTALLAVSGVVLFVRADPGALDLEPQGMWTATRLGARLRAQAVADCVDEDPAACVAALDVANHLNPTGKEPRAADGWREKARHAQQAPNAGAAFDATAVAERRRKALAYCKVAAWSECLGLLDMARRDNPQGDLAPIITVAREQAAEGLRHSGGDFDDAKSPPKKK